MPAGWGGTGTKVGAEPKGGSHRGEQSTLTEVIGECFTGSERLDWELKR